MLPPFLFSRQQSIQQLSLHEKWDLLVIGGGATGLGIAIDSASRGYKTLLLERGDFAKGTSSRSTKLVHGGVRYLARGDVRLVYDALRERGLLLQNAAHLVKKQSFVIPVYSSLEKYKYLVGLKVYDWLSTRYSFGGSTLLDAGEVVRRFPHIRTDNLEGGIAYFDGQFDDARLALNLAQTAAEQGATVINYCKVTGLVKNAGRTTGVMAVDEESGRAYRLQATVVVNATGVFVDEVLDMDVPERKPLVQASQGIHLVVDRSFLQSDSALMIPETSDGRVLFAVPWQNKVLLGTTDTPLEKHSPEPVALDSEIDFILDTVKGYLCPAPGRADVRSVFVGLRPLAAPEKGATATKEISRDHKLLVSASGLLSVIGGKWTTYRKMAEETVDLAAREAGLPPQPCRTKTIAIHGCPAMANGDGCTVYGTDQPRLDNLVAAEPGLSRLLSAAFPYTAAEVVWAARQEMARTVEDVLARRLRWLFLDAQAAMEAAPEVARILAAELGRDEAWQQEQVAQFAALAQGYLPPLKKKEEKKPEGLNLSVG